MSFFNLFGLWYLSEELVAYHLTEPELPGCAGMKMAGRRCSARAEIPLWSLIANRNYWRYRYRHRRNGFMEFCASVLVALTRFQRSLSSDFPFLSGFSARYVDVRFHHALTSRQIPKSIKLIHIFSKNSLLHLVSLLPLITISSPQHVAD